MAISSNTSQINGKLEKKHNCDIFRHIPKYSHLCTASKNAASYFVTYLFYKADKSTKKWHTTVATIATRYWCRRAGLQILQRSRDTSKFVAEHIAERIFDDKNLGLTFYRAIRAMYKPILRRLASDTTILRLISNYKQKSNKVVYNFTGWLVLLHAPWIRHSTCE